MNTDSNQIAAALVTDASKPTQEIGKTTLGTVSVSTSTNNNNSDNTTTDGTYSSTTAGTHTLSLTDGTSKTYNNITVTKTGDATGQSEIYDWYGTNAAVLASGGSKLTITTSGGSSAAIRSDRGGGTVTVNGGSYTTNGQGSPAIYSTAAINVTDADLTSNVAQVVVIEGGNSVTLENCKLTANHSTRHGNDSTYQAILIYQSMSGDASDGASSFSMTDGSLTNANGDIFCITNTTCTINLSGVTITNNDTSGGFLRAEAQKCGSSGSNGGKVTLNASGQDMAGNMIVDSSSSLALDLKDSSTFSGAINPSGQAGTVNITVEAGSTWTLTGDSYVTSLTNNGTITKGSYTLYVNGTAQ